jgi:hypothetical protein
MSGAFTSAGTEIYMGANMPITYDQSGFEAVVWKKIGEITSAGEYGRVYNSVTHNPLDDRRTVKRKGSYDDGELTLDMARVPSDEGQAVIITARDSDDSFPFKVVLQDGTVNYFSAQVMSYTTNVGSVDQITSASVSVAIDNDIIEIPGMTMYTVTFVAGANGSIIGDAVQTVPSGGDTTAVFAAADGGFAFTQWDDADTDNPRTVTNVLADVTYTASFA